MHARGFLVVVGDVTEDSESGEARLDLAAAAEFADVEVKFIFVLGREPS